MIASIEILGLIAGGLTTAAFVPQVYKTWKSKSADSLSLTMFMVFFVGIILWLIYGIYVNSLAMIITNSITAGLSLLLIYFKLTFK
ncbi:SemiSWEET transporter [Aureibaculum sp. 2210JD6-5]|uniref:SemiSWEET family sugar transporter n=1 Tax=Aureibaculum sp. 2210JD6-5 TaxID=3103957 RepID=UPI002AAD3997|nr:SemiSWEET transporter [Aureibaculum sp. 2210JD6-5]MDY7394805.1 SemiSWEET transporter [Aureibaculum sp. 2210JD6-5]